MSDELREKLADVQHAIWAHWMRYMFSCGTYTDDGWLMPPEKFQRWSRQMETSYAELTDKERMSDRDQADKVIAVIPPITGETSDGYHTFDELYRHRCLLFAWLLMYVWDGFKTRKNDKGEDWPGWFIAGVNTPYGQITYHLPDELWDRLLVPEIERNTGYDGHTSNDVIERMTQVIKDMAGKEVQS